MNESLYLTEEEFKILKNYSLLRAFVPQKTVLDYEDSPDKTKERIQLMELENSEIKNFRDQLAKGSASILQVIAGINFKNLSKNDYQELVYALGPSLISEIIQSTIKQSQQELMPMISGLSYLRHVLFGEVSKKVGGFSL